MNTIRIPNLHDNQYLVEGVSWDVIFSGSRMHNLLSLPLKIPGKVYSLTKFNSIARHVEDVEYAFVMYILCATTTES